MNMLIKIKKILRRIFIDSKNRKKLKNKNFTVISSNCNGGVILNELNQRFNSPTVNLFFEAEDYIKFLERMSYYLKCELIEIKKSNIKYPMGRLDDVTIHFMHYISFDDAKDKWNRRVQRIQNDNIFVMMTDRDGCTSEIISRFDKLPFKKKVIFTSKEMKEIKSAFYINGFENDGQVGELSSFVSVFSIKKYYDKFDFVKWFNN